MEPLPGPTRLTLPPPHSRPHGARDKEKGAMLFCFSVLKRAGLGGALGLRASRKLVAGRRSGLYTDIYLYEHLRAVFGWENLVIIRY